MKQTYKNSQQTNEGYLPSKKSSASSTLNAEKLEVFSFNWEPKMYILITPRKHLGDAVQYARKRNKRSQTGRGGIKWSLFSDNLTVYRGNKKIPTKKKKLLELVHEFSKIPGYKEPNIKSISMS